MKQKKKKIQNCFIIMLNQFQNTRAYIDRIHRILWCYLHYSLDILNNFLSQHIRQLSKTTAGITPQSKTPAEVPISSWQHRIVDDRIIGSQIGSLSTESKNDRIIPSGSISGRIFGSVEQRSMPIFVITQIPQQHCLISLMELVELSPNFSLHSALHSSFAVE